MLFVCVAVYLNWSYQSGETADAGKTLGEAALVNGQTSDPLVGGTAASPDPASSASPEAGTTGGGSYFDSARLNRQQANGEAIQTLANYTVSEAQIENLVTAKGYTDCVAFIGDESVSVVVSAREGGLTDADVAKITEIVTDETGMEASQVKIIEAE